MNKPGVNAKDGYDTVGVLCDLLEQWCADSGLPYESADELLMRPNLSTLQFAWLTAYSRLWEVTCGS